MCIMIDLAMKRVKKTRGANKKCRHAGELKDMGLPIEGQDTEE